MQARGSGDVGEDPDHPHGRRHGRRQQARIHSGEICTFFLEVRFDLKFEFLEIMKLKSDSDAGSVRNGALRRGGAGGAAPKKVAKGLIAFRRSLDRIEGREGTSHNFAKFQVTLEKICVNEGGRNLDSKLTALLP